MSLLNHVRLLRRWVPAPWLGRCEFGLTASDHLDCLSCDRCRHTGLRVADCGLRIEGGARGGSAAGQRPLALLARPLALGVIVVGLFVAGVSVQRFWQVMPAILEEPVVTAGAAGQPRDVDVKMIRTLIDQGRLSDHKASYSRPVE